jgi:hypothetical protein
VVLAAAIRLSLILAVEWPARSVSAGTAANPVPAGRRTGRAVAVVVACMAEVVAQEFYARSIRLAAKLEAAKAVPAVVARRLFQPVGRWASRRLGPFPRS